MILCIKHIGIEGPDTLGAFFERQRLRVQTVELQDGDPLPEDFDNLEAVVSLGGPMNVYEEDKYPFLRAEHEFLKKIVAREIPFIGICLGAQLLAKACGAKVRQSPEKEIGFLPVRLTGDGRRDPLFEGLPGKIDVFHWHEDMFELPPGSALLASSRGCPHQAFKVGSCAYGLQFHVEVTDRAINEWADAYFSPEDSSRAEQKRVMLADYRKKEDLFRRAADTVYRNFLGIMSLRNQYVQSRRSSN